MTTLLNAAGEGVELVSPDATFTLKADVTVPLAEAAGALVEIAGRHGVTVQDWS